VRSGGAARALVWLMPFLSAVCGRTAPAPGAAAEERASFVTLYRGDTTVVERFRRTPNSLIGELYLRPPSRRPDSARVAYHASLAPDGRVRRMELTIWRVGAPLEAVPLYRWIAEFRPDSVVAREESGTGWYDAYAVSGPVMPLYSPSSAMREAMTVWARRVGGGAKRVEFQIMPIASRSAAYPAYVEWVGRDSAIIVQGELRGVPRPVAVDQGGKLLGERRSGDFVFRRSP
jgi:hypothetical protein